MTCQAILPAALVITVVAKTSAQQASVKEIIVLRLSAQVLAALLLVHTPTVPSATALKVATEVIVTQ